MKIKSFTLAMMYLLLVSCTKWGNTENSRLIQQAQLWVETATDSAYTLLKDIPVKNLTKREYAEWCLLYTQSMDKLYMTHTSDTLIRAAVAYFEKRGNAFFRTKAYYYMGRVKQDFEDYAQAQEYYLKALKTGQTVAGERLLALIHSNLGMLYTFQNVYQEALPQMEEADSLFLKLGDTVNRAYVLRNIARTYHVMDSITLALRYYGQALEDMNGYGRYTILNELGNLHIDMKDYHQAELYIREALLLASPEDKQYVNLVLGRLFAETGKTDSARFYLKKCVDDSGSLTKAGALHHLADLAWKEEQWKESAQYQREYQALRDTIMKQRDAATMRKIQTLFNFKQIEEERNLALKKEIKAQRTSFISIIIALALLIVFFIWLKKLQKQKKERDELKERLNQIEIVKENEALMMQKFRDAEIYKKLHEKEKTTLTTKDKEELYATIDNLWPQFRPSIKILASNTKEDEILMCCLLKAGIKQVTVASYLNITDSAVANKRISLAKKMFGEQASKNDLTDFISNKKVTVWV